MPATYAPVVGHVRVKCALSRPVTSNCYIFEGPRAVGKRLTADRFALALTCKSGSPGCGCEACKNPAADVEVVCGKVGVSGVRDLIAQAKKRPYVSKRQVFILDGCEFSTAASNALLKILEEAPSHAIFILVVQPGQQVLPTVYSRARVLRFNLLTPAQVEEVAGETRREALHYMVSMGNVSLKNSSVSGEMLGWAVMLVNNVRSMTVVEVDEFIAEVVTKAEDPKLAATLLLDFLEYVLSVVVKVKFYNVGEDLDLTTPWTTAEVLAAVKVISRAREALDMPVRLEDTLFGLAMRLKIGVREI